MFDNQIGIFINGCLNLFHVVCLYVDFLSKYKFGTVPIKFRHSTITFYVYVYRFMFLAVKCKRRTRNQII